MRICLSRLAELSFLWLALAAASGCGATQGSSQFPSSGNLRALAERPAADHPQGDKRVDVEEWDLSGPLPDEISDQPAVVQGPWNDILNKIVNERPGLVLASASAHCLARELGLFYAAKRGMVTDSLRRFMAARCGMTGTPEIRTGYRFQEGQGTSDETSLAAQWAPEVREQLEGAIGKGAGAQLVGLWFGQHEGISILSYVVAPRQARIDPIPMIPNAEGLVTVTGEVLTRVERVEALINRGAHGFGRCEADSTIPLPRFRLRCRADMTDHQAMVQIAAFEPGRVLGHTVLTLLSWPKGELGRHYQRPSLSLAKDGAHPPGDAVSELTALVGQVRTQAGLNALRFSEAESQTARKLAPHYFAALAGVESETVADKVVLGLRAGWEVGAPLRVGQFTYGAVDGKGPMSRLLAEVLELPGGRETLLDPTMDHLAVGILGDERSDFVGAIFSTYATFDLGDPVKGVERVRARLNDLRSRRGKEASESQTSVEGDLAAVVRRVSAGELDVDSGLKAAIEHALRRTNTSVRGYYVDADNLDELTIADELLSVPFLRVAIGVGQYQPKDQPWRRYVVYFVTVDQAPTVACSHGGNGASAGSWIELRKLALIAHEDQADNRDSVE